MKQYIVTTISADLVCDRRQASLFNKGFRWGVVEDSSHAIVSSLHKTEAAARSALRRLHKQTLRDSVRKEVEEL